MTSIANYVAPTGPMDTRSFAERNVHLGAGDYVFYKFVEAEQASAERMASGEVDKMMNFNVQGRVFSIAVKEIDVDMESLRVPDEEKIALRGLVRPTTDDVQGTLLGMQEVEPAGANTYDFSGMTRQEIADAGKELFAAGKITLDELFRFDHPDGKLKMGTDGQLQALDPDEVIDFISETRKALQNMEATGEAYQAKSSYAMLQGLFEKLLMLG